MKLGRILAVVSILALSVSAASAVSMTATYDPNNGSISPNGVYADQIFTGQFGLDAPVTVSGNTFSLNYSFGGFELGGDLKGIAVSALSSDPGQLLWITGTLKLLGSAGQVLYSQTVANEVGNILDSNGYEDIGTPWVNLASFVTFSSLGGALNSIIFDGMIVANDSSTPFAPRTFGQGWIQVVGDNLQVAEITPVPIPAALPLLAAGLGAIGLLGWRKKRPAALATSAA